MTKIHILSKTGAILHCALYYVVPDNIYDSSAENAGRVPASDRLTQIEINNLKLGTITEEIVDFDSKGKAEDKVKDDLEKLYRDMENTALVAYSNAYSGYIDEAWDGTVWA